MEGMAQFSSLIFEIINYCTAKVVFIKEMVISIQYNKTVDLYHMGHLSKLSVKQPTPQRPLELGGRIKWFAIPTL